MIVPAPRVLPDPPPPPPPPPFFQWAVYRDVDGQLMEVVVGQQPSLDAMTDTLPPGLHITMLPEGADFETVRRYGFVDIDDPAKPIAYDADKLKADGLTLAEALAKQWAGVVTEWATVRPIKKPTKAT